MSLQWAARVGVVRHLRLGNALARPTRVISMQNQLRRVCLPTKSQFTRPSVSHLSALVCQQSHSFATTAETSNAKRGRKPGSSKRKKSTSAKPKPKKKKKVLTEDQKARKEQRERRAKIKALKATALEPPKKLATSAWSLAFASKFHEVRTESQQPKDTLREAATVIKAMSPDEYETYKVQAEKNKAANEAAFKSWLESHPVSQIKDANQARAQLSRLQKKKVRAIKDERLVKRPMTAFFIFMKERLASGDFKHLGSRETTPRVSAEWKSMTETEKQRYYDLQVRDRERYDREHLEAYGEAPKSTPRYTTPGLSQA